MVVSNWTHRVVQGRQGVQEVHLLCGGRQFRNENHTKGVVQIEQLNGDLKLDPQSCSGPSRGAKSASSLWWKANTGMKIMQHE